MIEFREVSKIYGPNRPALSGLSLAVGTGEFVLITGASGAGKTTLLKLLYAAERPNEGDVLIEGRSVARLHPRSVPWLRRNMGVVFQDFKLLPRRRIVDNVALSLEVCGTPRAEVQVRARKALERVGLGDVGQRLPGELSGGEQQRAAIARAIVNRPTILLADEPTGNLDPALSADIFDLLLDLCKERGTTVLVATHDQTQSDRLHVREVRLDKGRVIYDGPAGEADGPRTEPTVEKAEEAEAETKAKPKAKTKAKTKTKAKGKTKTKTKAKAKATARAQTKSKGATKAKTKGPGEDKSDAKDRPGAGSPA